METSRVLPVSPTRTAMTVGAYCAALMLVISSLGWQILGWCVFVGGIYWGMKRFKNEMEGTIAWFGAWNAGFQTAFFASLILAFVSYMTTKLEPSLMVTMLDAVEQQMSTMELPSGLAEKAILQWREILTPTTFAAITIFMYSAIGCFASIIYAFIICHSKPAQIEDLRT